MAVGDTATGLGRHPDTNRSIRRKPWEFSDEVLLHAEVLLNE